MDIRFLYDQWLEGQLKKIHNRKYSKPFIGERGYPHFDNKVFFPKAGNDSAHSALLYELVSDLEKLKQHPFFPFIKKDSRQRRYLQPPHDYEYTSARGQRDQRRFPHIKSRPIMYASHKDACIFSFFSFWIERLYEEELVARNLQNSVIAYRSLDGKNNIDFAKEAFLDMSKRDSFECILVDVKNFFDTLDHDRLWKQWDQILPTGFRDNPSHEIIFQAISSYRYLNLREAKRALRNAGRRYNIREQGCVKLCGLEDYNQHLKRMVKKNYKGVGIPQGSPISGVLANLYLLDFDEEMRRLVVDEHKGVYQRYSDDILIICPPGTSQAIYQTLKAGLAAEHLRLGANKTEVFRKNSGQESLVNITAELEPEGSGRRRELQYLGFHFNGKHIVLRPSTLAKHIRRKGRINYMRGAHAKTRDARLARQVNRVRRLMKEDEK